MRTNQVTRTAELAGNKVFDRKTQSQATVTARRDGHGVMGCSSASLNG